MKLVVALAVMLWAGRASAQVGPRAGGPVPGDDRGIHVAVDLSLAASFARGAVDRDLITARGQLTLRDGRWALLVQPYDVWGDAGGKQTDDERFLRVVAFRTLASPVFAFGVVALDHSLRRKIDARATSGGGVGATLVDTRALTLLSSVGLVGEIGVYDGTERRRARTVFRLFGRWRLASRLNLTHDIHVLPNVRDVGDVHVVASVVAEIPLFGGFAARGQLDATYEEDIVPTTKHGDVAWTVGASYKHDWP